MRPVSSAPEDSALSGRLVRSMLARVQDGRWPVGSALPGERVLMDEFAVSRVAIREAMAALRVLGVFEVAHGRRTRVRQVGAEVLSWLLPLVLAPADHQRSRHMLEVRLALEPQVAALAAHHRTPEHVEILYEAAAATTMHAQNGGPDFVSADLIFHRTLAKACGNPLLLSLAEALGEFYEHYVSENAAEHHEHRLRAARDHVALVSAVEAGDARSAGELMQAHLLSTASRQARPR